jgi:hypothetical protein
MKFCYQGFLKYNKNNDCLSKLGKFENIIIDSNVSKLAFQVLFDNHIRYKEKQYYFIIGRSSKL